MKKPVLFFLALCASLCLAAQAPKTALTLDECITVFDQDKVQNNAAGWAFWFIPKGMDAGITLKISSVFLRPGTHEPHRHNDDEAFYILQGPAIVHIDSLERTLPAGAAFYTPARSSHSIRRAGDGPIRYLVATRPTLPEPYPSMPGYTIDDCVTMPEDVLYKKGDTSDSFTMLGKKLSAGGLNMKICRIEPGVPQTQQLHSHAGLDAMFILEGEAEVGLDGQTAVIGPNTSFYCPPHSMHSIKRHGEQPLVFLVFKVQ